MTETLPSQPAPRYSTEAELVALIDHKLEVARVSELKSWELDREAVELLVESARRENSHGLVVEAREMRERADKLRVKAKNILEIHLPKLKQKLSVMRTPQIPQIDNGNPSVMR